MGDITRKVRAMSAFSAARSALVLIWAVALATSLVAGPPAAVAQDAITQTAPAPPPPVKTKPDPYQSPLATILSTRFWTDVPQEQDFVKTSRPDPKAIEYAPLVGKEPTRPKPRDAEGVAALQAELENGAVKNDAAAQDLLHPPAPVPPPVAAVAPAKPARHARKPVPKKTNSASAQ